MIKRNQTTIVVVLYLAISALYNAFGDENKLFWILMCYLSDNLIIAWAVARASTWASNVKAILLGYSFSIYKLLESLLFIYASIVSDGSVGNFWEIVNSSNYELFMMISSLILIWGSRGISKII